jgi:hypothetical protein
MNYGGTAAMTADELYGEGWAFYKRGGMRGGAPLPAIDDPLDLLEWMKGFGAAMADYDLDGRYPAIQAALLDCGIDGDELEELLDAAEVIRDGEEFCRWPSGRPIRGFGLPTQAVNDEMG